MKTDSTRLFDGLLNSGQLLDQIEVWLGRRPSRTTIYFWLRQGMPSVKVRCRRYFKRDEVARWLQMPYKSTARHSRRAAKTG